MKLKKPVGKIFPTGLYSEVYYIVNLSHKFLSEFECCYDFLVVFNVLRGEYSFLAVFEPFWEWLIASYVLFPLCLRNIIEILCLADIHSAVLVFRLYHFICAIADKVIRLYVKFRVHQVAFSQL